MIETKCLKIYAASKEQMEAFITVQSVDVLKAAYTEMLNGCIAHSNQWKRYLVTAFTCLCEYSHKQVKEKSLP